MKKLVIAEKPDVAAHYAKVLGCVKNRGYYEGDNYIVTYSLGHLFSMKEPGEYNEKWKKWKIEDLPIIPEKYNTKLLERTKAQYFTIKSLVDREDVEIIINGGDCGAEGELIQRWILLNTRTKKPIKRLWIDDMTEKEIKKGFNNLRDSKDYDKYFYAANTRAKIDWLIGMNYSRLYTLKAGNNQTLSLGRCQTPTLNEIVKRDKKIEEFEPILYYEIIANFNSIYLGKYIDNDSESKIFDKETCEKILNDIKKKSGKVESIEKEIKYTRPHKLFTLTDLQKTMASKYGFTEDKTYKLAQKLYEEHKILSYPRTSSNHLSDNIAEELKDLIESIKFDKFKKIIENISDENIEKIKNDKRFVDTKEVTDHYAIIPIENNNIHEIYMNLTEDEKIVFDEIMLRFISIFYDDYKYETTTILTKVDNYRFKTNGTREINKGWKSIYDDEPEEEKVAEESIKADIKEDETYNIVEELMLSNKTKKPPIHNSRSILAFMQKNNIGTDATRTEIIKTLIEKDYVIRDGVKLISTKLGKDLIETIDIKEIKSVELTSSLEKKLKGILNGQLDHQEVFAEAVELIKSNVEKVKEANTNIIEKNVESLGLCLKCKKGQILNKGKLYGCSRYEEGCDLAISTKIMGTQISEIQIKKLALKKRSDVLKFTKDGKEIKGYLYYDDKEEKVKIKYK